MVKFRLAPIFTATVVVGTLIWWFFQHFESMNQRGNNVVEQFAVEVLGGLPRYALFLTMTDLVTNSLRYVQVHMCVCVCT